MKERTQLSLHDTLAQGDFEKALRQETSSVNGNKQKQEAMRRLPLYLRLLSSSQALATVKFPETSNGGDGDDDGDTSKDSTTPVSGDNFVDEVVRLLEVVAVSHPSAENIDLLTSYLAPAACRSISRCSPVTKKYRLMNIHKYERKDHHDQDHHEPPEEEVPVLSKRSENGVKRMYSQETAISSNNAVTALNPTSSDANRESDGTRKAEYVLGKGILCTEDSFLLTGWDTEQLMLLGAPKKKKKESKLENDSDRQDDDKATHISLEHDDEDDDVDMGMEDTMDVNMSKESKRSTNDAKRKRENEDMMNEDSLQSSVCKTLEEIVSLVASSLKPIQCRMKPNATISNGGTSRDPNSNVRPIEVGEESNVQEISNSTKSNIEGASTQNDTQGADSVALTVKPDSLLSETAFSHNQSQIHEDNGDIDSSGGGYGYDGELSAVITSIMHHAPALRHEHLSSSLVRANIPQCADIIVRLAANSPCVAPSSLLRGCISAYQLVESDASMHDNENRANILSSARQAVRGIASLSKREAMHVICILQQSRVMPDLMLRLMCRHDPESVVATILHALESYISNEGGRDKEGDEKLQNGDCKESRMGHGCSGVRKWSKIKDIFANHSRDDKWIVDALRVDRDLALSMRQFLVKELTTIADEAEKESAIWGKVAMSVRTLGLLTYVVGIGAGSSEGSGSNFVEKSMSVLLRLSKLAFSEEHGREYVDNVIEDENIVATNSDESLSNSCRCDDFVEAAICTVCTICWHFPPLSTESNVKSAAVLACSKCFHNTSVWCVSDESKSFISRINALVVREDGEAIESMVFDSLRGEKERSAPGMTSTKNIGEFTKWAKGVLPPSRTSINHDENESSNLLSLLEIGGNGMSDTAYDSLIKKILVDPITCQKAYENKKAFDFIDTVISRMLDREFFPPPHVLPFTIEKNLTRCLNEGNLDSVTIVQLIYSFRFLEQAPDSPFVINPRSLPILEVFELLCHDLNELNSRLLDMIERWCPEVQNFCSDKLTLSGIGGGSSLRTCSITPKDMAHAICQCLKEKSTNYDHIEFLFIKCRAQHASIDVDAEAARAFLSSRFTTYLNLCRDPLILLQCSLSVWTTNGLRRIMLAVLQRALAVNESLILEASASSSVASEFLASRDSLAVRCFLFILSGSCFDSVHNEQHEIPVCQELITLLKQMISKRHGLVASIVKQGLPEKALDWMVRNIPEIFSDAGELSNILETHALTPKERLQVADGSLRIAIAHGSRNEMQSQRLAYNALSVLVSSFYLVIGPVGVPVTLTCDEQGQDITLICRKVLFRMLSTLQNGRTMSERLKSEAMLALSRMASLCKSDALLGGLGGTALKKRKALLKEVFDAIVRVNVSFGGGIQL